MNQIELLDQFVIESRECLQAIGARLLDVEREPNNLALLNDLFRSVHTLKGNCGLFDFKALERVVHAGEDLLDRVRNQTLNYSPDLADALLQAMDYSASLIDQIASHGCIAEGEESESKKYAQALRLFFNESDAVLVLDKTAPAASAVATTETPDWLTRIDRSALAECPGALALNYVPEPGCFYKGEDPWRLARTTPGLKALQVKAHQPWPSAPELASWDCYQCNMDFVVVTSAPRSEVEQHFRCVPEQVAYFEQVRAPVATSRALPGMASLRQRAAQLWANQCALLARSAIVLGGVISARISLRHILHTVDESPTQAALTAMNALPDGRTALLDWAQQQSPLDQDAPTTDAADEAREPGRDAARLSGQTLRTDDAASQPQKVLKVSQEKIDRLMELVGEMVVAKNSLPYLAQRAETVFEQRELAREIKAQYAVINRIAEDMQHAVMQVRMLPVGAVFQRFGRLVRDISRKLGKEVNLVIEGEDTEADKNVIEPLSDPLIHILRNSLDHGIETPEVRREAGKPAIGTIRIRASQASDRVVIEISDDGAGVNPARVRVKAIEKGLIPADKADQLSDEEAVQLIFLPGFSTADSISDLSGRGVGMDVVRTAIERINGGVELSSVQGKGTTLRLSLPLSIAVTNVMVIESAGRRLGIPMDMIVETVRVHAEDIHTFKKMRTTVLRGRIVPLRALNDLLALDADPLHNAEGELAVLVIRLGNQNVGLLVDQFHGACDIILKPLEGVLAGLTGFAGTALMGDGGVLMVLNPKELL